MQEQQKKCLSSLLYKEVQQRDAIAPSFLPTRYKEHCIHMSNEHGGLEEVMINRNILAVQLPS